MSWMTTIDAMHYLGINTIEELDAIVLAYNVDVEVDDQGELISLLHSDLKEALFDLHEAKVGHRPDSPEHVEMEKKRMEKELHKNALRRKSRRKLLEKRVGK